MVYVSAISLFISIVLLVYLLRNKEMIKSSYLLLLSLAIVLYLVGNFIEIAGTTLDAAHLGLIIRFMGVPFIPTLWLFCVREFCGIKPKSKHSNYWFWVLPMLFCLLFVFWEKNHLLITDIYFYGDNPKNILLFTPGAFYIVFVAYQFAINLWGIGTLVWSYRRGTPRFQKQANLFLASVLIPVFNTLVYHLYLLGHYVDITPYALLLSMIVFTVALYSFGVFNLARIIKENTLDNLPEGILLFDKDGIYVDSNIAAKAIFNELSSLPLGTSISAMEYLPFGEAAIQNKEEADLHEQEFTREHGGVLKTFAVSSSAITRRDKTIGYSFTLHNITPLKDTMSQLEEKSISDPLTGIFNRAYWFNLGEIAFAAARGGQETYCVIMFDIDHFKKVNDSCGHVFGDYVLKTLALLCASNLRKTDTLARYGGEEFCILLHNSSLENAAAKAERLRKLIANFAFELDGIKIAVTVSFGVAQHQSTDTSFMDSVKEADIKLYAAKNGGRNKVCT